jgi:hypothetical protein
LIGITKELTMIGNPPLHDGAVELLRKVESGLCRHRPRHMVIMSVKMASIMTALITTNRHENC